MTTRSFIFIVFLILLAVSGPTAPSVQGDDKQEFAERFRERFRDLTQLDRVVKDLSDPAFSVRESATQRLLELPIQPAATLKRLCQMDGFDVEARFRIRYVLEYGSTDRDSQWDQVKAMLDRIHREEVTGLAEEVLALLDCCEDDEHYRTCERAFFATATHEDIELLRRAMKRSNPKLRISTVMMLTRLGTPDAIDALLEHKSEGDEAVQLALGGGLIQLGRREGLPWLIDLMVSADLPRRTRAAVLLQSATGRNEGFFSATEQDALDAVVRRWRVWLAEKGDTIELRHLESAATARSPFD